MHKLTYLIFAFLLSSNLWAAADSEAFICPFNLTVSIGSGNDLCGDPLSASTCGPPPVGQSSLSILANETPSVVVGFVVENTSAVNITSISHRNDVGGAVIQTIAVNILPGQSLSFWVLETAPTTLGNNYFVGQVQVTFATGQTCRKRRRFRISVANPPPPVVNFDAAIGNAVDYCTSPFDLYAFSCSTYPGPADDTLYAYPGDTALLGAYLENIGSTVITYGSYTDSNYGLLLDGAMALQPGFSSLLSRVYPVPTIPGTYHITMTASIEDDAGGSLVISDDYVIIVTNPPPRTTIDAGLKTNSEALTIYPNPVNTTFQLSDFDGGQVSIIDQAGRIYQEQYLRRGETLDVRHLPSGIYFSRVATAEGVEVLRFVKR